jgi:transglutaminase-like putative cysteine protease
MKLRVIHSTRYLYSGPVSMCHTEAHLEPRDTAQQTILERELTVTPEPGAMHSREDYFGNHVSAFSIEEPHRELMILSRFVADLNPSPAPNLELSPPWEEVRDEVSSRNLTPKDSPARYEAGQFVFDSPHTRVGAAFAAYAAVSFKPGRRFLDAVNDLSGRIYREFRYDPRATTISTPVEDVLRSKRGVCQDFAHLMISCLRSLQLPARYISGYVRTGGKLAGADASHAWVSVWCPLFGWQDFDPTNNVIPQGDHVTVAWGRDYSDVAPVKGVALGGGEQVISVSVDVRPFTEDGKPVVEESAGKPERVMGPLVTPLEAEPDAVADHPRRERA